MLITLFSTGACVEAKGRHSGASRHRGQTRHGPRKVREMSLPSCCACQGVAGSIVHDLGKQPASDNFPLTDDTGPNPTYKLQLWLCAECGLPQLADAPTDPNEPLGVEPAAAVAQPVQPVKLLAPA